MKLTRTTLIVVLALSACSRDKVQPADSSEAVPSTTTAESAAKAAEAYKLRQAAFADSVLKAVTPTTAIAKRLGKGYSVGGPELRDSLLSYIAKAPQCYQDGKRIDPFLAGTVSFLVNMNVVGSDIVRVQESQWTSQAGNVSDRCFNDAARQWKFGMGIAKAGAYILQVQFR